MLTPVSAEPEVVSAGEEEAFVEGSDATSAIDDKNLLIQKDK